MTFLQHHQWSVLGPTLVQYDLILTWLYLKETLLPNKVIFTGLGVGRHFPITFSEIQFNPKYLLCI
jgi:hypothetical protein